MLSLLQYKVPLYADIEATEGGCWWPLFTFCSIVHSGVIFEVNIARDKLQVQYLRPVTQVVNMAEKSPTVLIAVDESEYSQKALDYYVNYIHKPGNTVVVAHCLEIPFIPDPAHPDIVSRILNEKRASAKAVEKKYVQLLKDKGIECKVLLSDFDFGPGHFIIDSAQRQKAGLIVIGTRGLGTIRRTIMGSVSDYVVHHAHCPVVVCRETDVAKAQ